MHRRLFLLGGAAGAALLATQAAAVSPPTRVDLIIHGGPIYTADDTNPRVEAVAVAGDRIVAAGRLADVESWGGADTRRIDLRGAAMFPGFTDAHAHLLGIGQRELTLNLEGSASLEAMLAAVRAWAAAHPEERVLTGRGWIETHWPERRFPSRQDIDAVVADRPVILRRADGHALVANSAALRAAGVTAATRPPSGGEILKDSGGEPTGMLIDAAQELVGRIVPNDDPAGMDRALDAAFRVYAAYGWTGLHNMSVSEAERRALEARDRRRAVPLRVYNAVDPEAAPRLLSEGPSLGRDGYLITRCIKVYADGALGSRGAALFEPYADRPETRGLMQTSAAEITPLYEKALRAGVQMTTHAIGDRGNASVLEWYEAAFRAVPPSVRPVKEPRFRIEHAQVLRLQDIPRFARLGVIPSMQASHAIGDLYFAPARLGDARLDGAYAWKRLIDAGAIIPGGTDAPVERGDPLIEFYAAVARRSLDGFQGPDWRPDQAVDRSTALKMFTVWPAYASFRESELGQIRPGYRADFTVFSVDLMTAPAADIPKAHALLTMVGGQAVYRRDGW
ncbi:MAG: amidohydrolase [Caulobacteraceae bacterium]|nr:amidohydrolase [Caulobacteraceae bacterium]